MKRFIICFALALVMPTNASASSFQYVQRFSSVEIWGDIHGAPPPEDHYWHEEHTSTFQPFDQTVEDEINWNGVSAGGQAQQASSLAFTVVSAQGSSWIHLEDDPGRPTPTPRLRAGWSSSST